MTVSEYIFNFLHKKGCNTVYMVSGSSAMWLTDALYKNHDLQAVCCHHEQAAAMAADGYGRVHDVPGACLVTIGPGATNAITGVAQAYLDSSPMFVISGQANSRLLKYQIESGMRQNGTQSITLEPLVSSITKYFALVMEPDKIQFHMEKAYYKAMHGRKGPVWIDVPVDIQNKLVPESMCGFKSEEKEISVHEDDLNYVITALKKSQKPLILAGYGIRSANACEELKSFSEHQEIPITTSRGGIDIIGTDNPLFIGRPGSYGDRASHFAIQQCDLLLILGSRLSVSTIGYYPDHLAENAVKIMVDIDEKELERDAVPINYQIQADLKYFMKELNNLLNQRGIRCRHPQWLTHCLELKKKYPNVLPKYQYETPINAYYFTSRLSEIVPQYSNICVDTGSVCNIVSQSWKLKEGQRYLISGGLSCMGFWATAIGACQKNRMTVALAGDGSTQMNIQEFATLQYNHLPVKLFIYNNNGYMLIRHNQHNYMKDRFLGVGPDSGVQTPDFVEVAKAYGIKAVKITKEDDIVQKIQDVMEYDGPVVCEVMVQEFAPIIPRIASKVMPDGSLKAAEFDDLYPFLEEKEYD
ncbi:MAG: thiamine pyrophosphate-binding protein [Lachnospiraceae bacterium]|jgi:acetolactate synthase-1/2/3 large subunit|nr:thiamine pyrophosphate-binding protein [Lachnospiraceae bacterium]